VGVTFAKFEPRLYGSIFGIIFAIGLLGGTFVPQIVGNLSVGPQSSRACSSWPRWPPRCSSSRLFLGVGSRPPGRPIGRRSDSEDGHGCLDPEVRLRRCGLIARFQLAALKQLRGIDVAG